MSTYSWATIKEKLREAIVALPNFFKNPVQGMRQLPNWEWPELIILQCAFALVAATLKNIVDRDVLGLFIDILLAPMAAVLVVGVACGIFFYAFKFIFGRDDIPFRGIYTHLVFAAIPSQVTNIVSKYLPPINLLGVGATLMLLYVGFTSNYFIDRAKLKKWFIGIFALIALSWAAQLVKSTFRQEGLRMKATPESLDILEKELNDK